MRTKNAFDQVGKARDCGDVKGPTDQRVRASASACSRPVRVSANSSLLSAWRAVGRTMLSATLSGSAGPGPGRRRRAEIPWCYRPSKVASSPANACHRNCPAPGSKMLMPADCAPQISMPSLTRRGRTSAGSSEITSASSGSRAFRALSPELPLALGELVGDEDPGDRVRKLYVRPHGVGIRRV